MASEEKVTVKVETDKPDWSIDDLYRRAWDIVKKNKILWVLGAAIGGGSSFNYQRSVDNKDIEQFKRLFENGGTTPPDITRVLGDATSASSDFFTYLFSAIPFSFYVLLGIEVGILVIFSIIMSMIYHVWSHGTLLASIESSIKDGKASLHNASEKVFKVLKQLMLLQYIPALILAFGSACAVGVMVALMFFVDGTTRIGLGFSIAALVFLIIIAGVFLGMAQIWSQRMVVQEKRHWRDALKAGIAITKKKFWAMGLLSFVNNLLIVLIFFAPLAFIAGLAIGAAVAFESYRSLSIVLFGFVGLLIFGFIIVATVGTGIANAFKATVWTLAYQAIKGKYDK